MIDVEVHVEDALRAVRMVAQQMPFAVSIAVKNLALDFQAAERQRLAQIFTLRRPDFVEKQGVKMLQWPTKADPTAIVGTDPKADFLAKFEDGGEKTARSGGSLSLPVDARRNKHDIITPANRPRALIDAAKAKRIFVVRPGDTDPRVAKLAPGIYQRIGRHGGHDRLKLLFAFEPHAEIPATLGFHETAVRIAQERWPQRFAEAMAQAIATAR
jgi:hypothetical protein